MRVEQVVRHAVKCVGVECLQADVSGESTAGVYDSRYRSTSLSAELGVQILTATDIYIQTSASRRLTVLYELPSTVLDAM